MTKFNSLSKGLMLLVFVFATASLASAQATRTWVSGVGDDVNPCSRTAPCKTFAGAISKTADKGEINAIDSGGFGAITIVKNITIDGQGVMASILASGTTGVVVNGAGVTVRLRNLSIQGAGTGVHGIRGIAFGKLFVENCAIAGFQSAATSRGIKIEGAGQVFVKDTNISNSASGIEMSAGTLLTFMVDNVRVEGMTNGIILGANANGTIRNTSMTLNSSNGLQVLAGSANVELESCQVSQNGTGITPASGGTIVFSNTSVFGSPGPGIATVGGAILTSHGNNQFTLNGGGSLPTIIGQQ